VWTNALTAITISRGEFSPAATVLSLLAVSMFYTGGMFLNDAFDREIDAAERPERPIPSGLVETSSVFVAGYAQLAIGASLLTALAADGGPRRAAAAALAALALAGTIIRYDMRHKGSALAPVVMSACRGLVYVCVAVAVAGTPNAALLAGAAALMCYVAGLTYVAAQENLAAVSNLWPLAVLAVPLLYTAQWIAQPTLACPLMVVFYGWTLFALSFLVRARRDVRGAVSRLIAGISLFDAVLIAAYGAPVAAIVAFAMVGLTRLLQRAVPGT
jgi:4-hydroxybenzoate polyprenyltransferase